MSIKYPESPCEMALLCSLIDSNRQSENLFQSVFFDPAARYLPNFTEPTGSTHTLLGTSR